MSAVAANARITLCDTATILRNIADVDGGVIHAESGLVELNATDTAMLASNQAGDKVRKQ